MTISQETAETIRKGIEEREHIPNDPSVRGIVRVDIQVSGGLTYHAQTPSEPQFTMIIDEPEERGGGGQGPSPLVYFLTGAATCFLNQFIRLGIARGIDLEFKEMHVRGERERGIGGAFQHIIQEVHAEGSASQQEIEELTTQAEAFCYVHATLRKAVKMTTVVHVNGAEAVRRTSEPPALAAS
jgi:uncharacterized OsmC-like protein